MKATIFLASVLLTPSVASAQSDLTKNDFAYGKEIRVETSKSVIKVSIPEDVYRMSQNATLADIAVFNERGELVPHSLSKFSPGWNDKTPPARAFPVFEIYGKKDQPSSLTNIQVSTADGSLVEVKPNKTVTQEESTIGYLIDASSSSDALEKFEVSPPSTGPNHFLRLTVEGSNDLNNWSMVQSNAVVGAFVSGKTQLSVRDVPLNGPRFRYYKISRIGNEELFLSYVTAKFSTRKEQEKVDFLWKEVKGEPIDTKNLPLYEFDLQGYYPISGIRMTFAEPNSFAEVSLETKSGEAWLGMQSASFFSATEGNETFSISESLFPERTARFWRMQLLSPKSGIGSHFPKVAFAWHPGTLKFVKRGEGPFTLAYGSARVANPPQTTLVETMGIAEVGNGTVGETFELGGAEPLTPLKQADSPWNKIILWILLAAAVVFVSAMAIRAKKEIVDGQK